MSITQTQALQMLGDHRLRDLRAETQLPVTTSSADVAQPVAARAEDRHTSGVAAAAAS
jgi:hypothetical protein